MSGPRPPQVLLSPRHCVLLERLARRATSPHRLVRRVSGALLSGSYRYESDESETADGAGDSAPERQLPSLSNGENYRPYFEALFVSPAPAANRAASRAGRRSGEVLRRELPGLDEHQPVARVVADDRLDAVGPVRGLLQEGHALGAQLLVGLEAVVDP